MSRIRSRSTKPEERLGVLVREVFPRRRVVQHATDLPGKPDYFLPGLKLAIFADGCFWHSCPQHGRAPDDNADYWGPKLARNRERDHIARRELRRLGIRVVRFWEHELKRDVMHAARRKLARSPRR
jgi:DNA mismatch endonuclease (patch repair protein)